MAKYTRVRDKDTGHQYDVLSHKVDPDLHEVLTRFPQTLTPRTPKPNVKRSRARTSPTDTRRGRTTPSSTDTDPGAASA